MILLCRSVVLLKKAAIILLVFLLCLTSVNISAYAEPAVTPAYSGDPIKAQSFVLMDASSGSILYSQNPDEQIYPASTTKIMTAILAIESGKLDDIVTITPEGSESAFNSKSSLMGLVHRRKNQPVRPCARYTA